VAVILREAGHDERTIADALGQCTIEMASHYAKGADLRGEMRGVVNRHWSHDMALSIRPMQWANLPELHQTPALDDSDLAALKKSGTSWPVTENWFARQLLDVCEHRVRNWPIDLHERDRGIAGAVAAERESRDINASVAEKAGAKEAHALTF
jgi:hypothetical protein